MNAKQETAWTVFGKIEEKANGILDKEETHQITITISKAERDLLTRLLWDEVNQQINNFSAEANDEEPDGYTMGEFNLMLERAARLHYKIKSCRA